jgi:hypothetical protein
MFFLNKRIKKKFFGFLLLFESGQKEHIVSENSWELNQHEYLGQQQILHVG